jgi:asparagine synthase (glutamine-hydrolysing)
MTVPQIMYMAAHKKGVKVLLDGVDGDLVSSNGENYLAHLLRSGMWKTTVDEAFGYSEFWNSFAVSPWGLLFRSSRTAFAPPVLRKLRRRLRSLKSIKSITKNTIINIDFARRIGLRERLETMLEREHPTRPITLREAQANALQSPSITAALERYDGVAAAYSVEPRHPFFDKRLVEFCLGLPWDKKVHQGRSKITLRRTMGGILPEEVCWRAGGEHLGPDFIRSAGALEQELIDQLTHRYLHTISEYVSVPAVRDSYQRYVSGGTIEDMYRLWQAVTLVLWLRRN